MYATITPPTITTSTVTTSKRPNVQAAGPLTGDDPVQAAWPSLFIVEVEVAKANEGHPSLRCRASTRCRSTRGTYRSKALRTHCRRLPTRIVSLPFARGRRGSPGRARIKKSRCTSCGVGTVPGQYRLFPPYTKRRRGSLPWHSALGESHGVKTN